MDRARAYLYRAELAIYLKDTALAQKSLAAAEVLGLSEHDRDDLAEELARIAKLVVG